MWYADTETSETEQNEKAHELLARGQVMCF